MGVIPLMNDLPGLARDPARPHGPGPVRPPTPGRRRHRRAFIALAILSVLGACSGGDGGREGSPTTTARGSETTSAPLAPEADTGARALGTVAERGAGRTCLDGADECLLLDVSCPDLDVDARVELDVRTATAEPRGVVVLFSGAGGGGWWAEDVPDGGGFLDDLGQQGLTTVQVAWRRASWLDAAPGEDAGTARVGCRPATVARWIHDTVYAPLGVEAARSCGFCVTGTSGGASQIAYALSFYGLDDLIDVAVLASGPPHGAEAKGCLRNPGEEAYWYGDASQLANIETSFGVATGEEGACARHDEAWLERWRAESLATGGNDYDHPETRMVFVLGQRDDTPAPAHARDYIAALEAGGDTPVTVAQDLDMPHRMNEVGLAVVRDAVVG